MKLRSIVIASAIGIGILVSVAIIVNSDKNTHENKIRVAFFPNIGHAIPIVGMEHGAFQDQIGKQTVIETRLFDSGPQVIESMFSDSIDIAYVGPGPAINGFLKSKDHKIVIIAGAASGGASFVIHPESSIDSADDLSGKRIAAPQIGNTQDVSLRHYLKVNELKPAEKGGSVVVLNVPNADIYTLFVKGDIDAAWVPEPWATRLVDELGGIRLFYEEELWPDNRFTSVLLIARDDYIEEHKDIVQNWLEAHKQTEEWIVNNPEQTRIIFNEFMKRDLGKALPDSLVDKALANFEITSDPIKDSVYTFAERANDLGYLGRDGYDLNGIFYDVNNISNVEVVSDDKT